MCRGIEKSDDVSMLRKSRLSRPENVQRAEVSERLVGRRKRQFTLMMYPNPNPSAATGPKPKSRKAGFPQFEVLMIDEPNFPYPGSLNSSGILEMNFSESSESLDSLSEGGAEESPRAIALSLC